MGHLHSTDCSTLVHSACNSDHKWVTVIQFRWRSDLMHERKKAYYFQIISDSFSYFSFSLFESSLFFPLCSLSVLRLCMLNEWSSSGIWDDHHIDTSAWALVEFTKTSLQNKSSNVSEKNIIISTCWLGIQIPCYWLLLKWYSPQMYSVCCQRWHKLSVVVKRQIRDKQWETGGLPASVKCFQCQTGR